MCEFTINGQNLKVTDWMQATDNTGAYCSNAGGLSSSSKSVDFDDSRRYAESTLAAVDSNTFRLGMAKKANQFVTEDCVRTPLPFASSRSPDIDLRASMIPANTWEHWKAHNVSEIPPVRCRKA